MTKIKPFEELTIKDDYMFKRVMSNKKLCIKMLERILDKKIKDIVYQEEEKTLSAGYFEKGVRLDVYVEDDLNTVYDIEMQVRSLQDDELAKRIRYYQSAIDTSILEKGEIYKKLKETYIIFICPFKVFDGKRHKYTLKTFCEEDKGLKVPDGAIKMVLSTKGELDDVSAEMKAFLEYVDGKFAAKDDLIGEIESEIEDLKKNAEERVGYMTYSMKFLEAREEGREDGIKEGLLLSLKNLMETMKLGMEEAMNALKIPQTMRQSYVEALSKN